MLDWMGFPSSMYMTNSERRANDASIKRARQHYHKCKEKLEVGMKIQDFAWGNVYTILSIKGKQVRFGKDTTPKGSASIQSAQEMRWLYLQEIKQS